LPVMGRLPGCQGWGAASPSPRRRGIVRLVFCDDNRILCEALAAAMEAWGHQVVAITTNAADGIAAVGTHRPDAVLLELRFPARTEGAGAGEGLSAAKAMRERYPDTAVLVLSGLADRPTWSAAMKIGVAGFLGKDQDVGQVAAALDEIGAGRVVFDPMVPSQASFRAPSRRRASSLHVLTPREKEVLRRIVAGQGTAQMADEMDIAINTLRSYVKNVLTKLGAHSRLQAAALAMREDLLSEMPA
jgi:two-component system, NarL family, nitrate/nitrite response regulator NarL